MPKIKPNTPKRKMTITRRPILIVVIILIIAVVTLILAKILTNTAADGENQSDHTTSETTAQTEALGASAGSDEAIPNKTPKQYEGADPNTYDELTGVITYAEVNHDTLIIRTNIDQYISGVCDLTITNNDKVITKTSSIDQNPSTSSCAGFDIPTSELGTGTWQIAIKLIGDNKKTGTLTKEVTL